MIIQNTNFSIFFPKIQNLRRKIVEHESTLSSYFLPYNILPIPDEAPEEIPRIIMKTINGHSDLQISLTGASFSTVYDGSFQKSWDECHGYLNDRIKKVYGILHEALNQEKFLFSGLTTQIIFDDLKDEPVKLIKEKLFNIRTNTEPYDLNSKITFVYDDEYYINLTIMNMRFYEGLIPLGNLSLAKLQEKAHQVGLIIDINDRYGFNHKNERFSNLENIEKIFSITTDILKNKVSKFIQEGVFDL